LAHKFAWGEFEQPKAGPEGGGQDARSKDAVKPGQVRARWRYQRREFGDEIRYSLSLEVMAEAPSAPPEANDIWTA